MRQKTVYRLAHYLNGKEPIVLHAAVGDAWSGRTLCGAHEGRWGYELQVKFDFTPTCLRCRRSPSFQESEPRA